MERGELRVEKVPNQQKYCHGDICWVVDRQSLVLKRLRGLPRSESTVDPRCRSNLSVPNPRCRGSLPQILCRLAGQHYPDHRRLVPIPKAVFHHAPSSHAQRRKCVHRNPVRRRSILMAIDQSSQTNGPKTPSRQCRLLLRHQRGALRETGSTRKADKESRRGGPPAHLLLVRPHDPTHERPRRGIGQVGFSLHIYQPEGNGPSVTEERQSRILQIGYGQMGGEDVAQLVPSVSLGLSLSSKQFGHMNLPGS